MSEYKSKKCVPCEGGVPKLTHEHVTKELKSLPDWELHAATDSIQVDFKFKNFVKAMEFINRIAELAESEGHHPDIHLTSYRNVKIVLTTHAIQGLSENDLILAAKISDIPSGSAA